MNQTDSNPLDGLRAELNDLRTRHRQMHRAVLDAYQYRVGAALVPALVYALVMTATPASLQVWVSLAFVLLCAFLFVLVPRVGAWWVVRLARRINALEETIEGIEP